MRHTLWRGIPPIPIAQPLPDPAADGVPSARPVRPLLRRPQDGQKSPADYQLESGDVVDVYDRPPAGGPVVAPAPAPVPTGTPEREFIVVTA